MYSLTDRVTLIFRAAGWSESRQVDTTKTVSWLTAKGYGIGPLAKEFLANCIGLELKGPGARVIKIQPVAALAWLSDESAKYIEAFMQERACPIAHGSQMVVLLGVSGRCVLLKDDWLGYNDTDHLGDAFERLLFPSEYSLRWHDLTEDQLPPDL
jgi:hypothetical protein